MAEQFKVKIGNKTKTFPSYRAAAKAFGISYNVFYQRLFVMGWSAKDTVGTKVAKKKPRKASKSKAKKRK